MLNDNLASWMHLIKKVELSLFWNSIKLTVLFLPPCLPTVTPDLFLRALPASYLATYKLIPCVSAAAEGTGDKPAASVCSVCAGVRAYL